MENFEIEIRKIMKEKFNIEIPKNYSMFQMVEAEEYGTYINGMKEYSRSGNFDNIYIVLDERGNWGFVDIKNGVYIEPICYDVSAKDKYIVMNEVMPKYADGTKSYFHHIAYDTTSGNLSVDLKTTKDISKSGAKLSEELFEDEGDLTVQAQDCGFQTISVNEKMGLLSEDTMTRYIEPQYDILMLAWGDVEELCNQITKKNQIYCVVKNNKKFGVVDLKNNIILPINFSSFDDLESYAKEQISQIEV